MVKKGSSAEINAQIQGGGIGVPPTDPIPTESSPLPNIKKFRENFAGLDIDDEEKDTIYTWWVEVERTEGFLERLFAATSFSSLPDQERKDAEKSYKASAKRVSVINTNIRDFLNKPKSFTNLFTSNDAQYARGIVTLIENLDEESPLKFYQQVIAVCEAIEVTKDLKQGEKVIRQKIAQWGFQEMMALMPYWKLIYQYDLEIETPTTVDPLEMERAELIDSLKRDRWDNKERAQWRAIYKNFTKVMKAYEFYPEVKRDFKYVYDMAMGVGDLQKTSAIKILFKVEEAFTGIGNDPTLQDAWEEELDRLMNPEDYEEEDEEDEEE